MKALPSYPNPLLRGWRMPEGVPAASLWYRLWRRILQVGFAGVCRVEVFNRHYEPASGAALYICNHQSFLDPPLMSMALRRPMNYMARDSLFRFKPFGWMIRSFNAFPVKRASADTGALREALRRLKAGGQLVVFPEGTRTRDGRVGPFLPGVTLLAQRGAEWVVPVIIDGAFECWPRTRRLPRPGWVVVAYARPLHRSQCAGMKEGQLLDEVRRRMIELQRQVRAMRGKPPLE